MFKKIAALATAAVLCAGFDGRLRRIQHHG